MKRYTAEHRGELFPTEWCIIDEDIAPVGSCVLTGLPQFKAEMLAREWNERENNERTNSDN